MADKVITGDRPRAGDHCPRCGDGVLQLIAENADGYTLRCWNCDTTGSIHRTEPFVAAIAPEQGDASGFTLTTDQYAARGSVDPEQAATRTRAGDQNVPPEITPEHPEQPAPEPQQPATELQ